MARKANRTQGKATLNCINIHHNLIEQSKIKQMLNEDGVKWLKMVMKRRNYYMWRLSIYMYKQYCIHKLIVIIIIIMTAFHI